MGAVVGGGGLRVCGGRGGGRSERAGGGKAHTAFGCIDRSNAGGAGRGADEAGCGAVDGCATAARCE